MGQMKNALLLVFAIEAAFYIFLETGYSETSLFTFLLGPENWEAIPYLNSIITAVALLGAAGIVVGTFISPGGREWIWRAAMVSTSITFGSALFHLSDFVYGAIHNYFPENAAILTALVISPFLLYFIFVSIDFISGKD